MGQTRKAVPGPTLPCQRVSDSLQYPLYQPHSLSDIGPHSLYIESTGMWIEVGKYTQIRLCLVRLPSCLKMGKNI